MSDVTRRTALMSLGTVALAGTLAVGGATSATAATTPAARGGRKVTVHLVRHGQTWLNVTGRIQGWSDSPLTEAGVDVARRVGRHLAAEIGGFDAAYSADMVRHFETASGILAAARSSLTPKRVPALREVAYGGWEGEKQSTAYPTLMGAITNDSPTLADIINAFQVTNPVPAMTTESWRQVADRMKAALTAAATSRSLPRRHGGSILAVSSGMSIMALLESLGAETPEGGLENGAVSRLSYVRGAWTVEAVGEMHYAE